MGTSLTGLTPSTTYDALIKVTDNGPLSATLKLLSDGLGNDSALALSTSITAIRGGNQLRLFRADNAVYGSIEYLSPGVGFKFDDVNSDGYSFAQGVNTPMRITPVGNVGIGTSSPAQALDVNGSIRAVGGSYDPTTSAWINAAFATKVNSSPYGGGLALIDGTGGWTQYTLGSGTALVFAQGATSGATTEYARLTNGGYLRLATGGIQFNGDTSASNALDDYEEGTWTMGISFGNASAGVTYVLNTGSYTKIGRQVTVNGYMSLSSKGSSTGNARITGLPFTILNSTANYAAASFWLQNVSFINQYSGISQVGTTNIEFFETTNLGVLSALVDTDFANNSEIIVNLTYFV